MSGESTDSTATESPPSDDGVRPGGGHTGDERFRSDQGERHIGWNGRAESHSTGWNGRGVSYALGFVVVFSVAIAGTLALFVVGVDLLSEVDRDEAMATNEESIEVIHSEVGDMAAQGDDRREMQLDLVDAQLRLTGSEAVTLRIETDDVDLPDIEYDTRALLYEIPPYETTFVYAFGHVYRVDKRGDGSVLSEKPPVFEVSTEQTRLVVPVLAGLTDGSPTEIGVTGTGERELVAHSGASTSFTRTGTDETGVDTLSGSVRVEGVEYPSGWVAALETTGFGDVETTADGTAVTGTFATDRLTVEKRDIAFTLGAEGSS